MAVHHRLSLFVPSSLLIGSFCAKHSGLEDVVESDLRVLVRPRSLKPLFVALNNLARRHLKRYQNLILIELDGLFTLHVG